MALSPEYQKFLDEIRGLTTGVRASGLSSSSLNSPGDEALKKEFIAVAQRLLSQRGQQGQQNVMQLVQQLQQMVSSAKQSGGNPRMVEYLSKVEQQFTTLASVVDNLEQNFSFNNEQLQTFGQHLARLTGDTLPVLNRELSLLANRYNSQGQNAPAEEVGERLVAALLRQVQNTNPAILGRLNVAGRFQHQGTDVFSSYTDLENPNVRRGVDLNIGEARDSASSYSRLRERINRGMTLEGRQEEKRRESLYRKLGFEREYNPLEGLGSAQEAGKNLKVLNDWARRYQDALSGLAKEAEAAPDDADREAIYQRMRQLRAKLKEIGEAIDETEEVLTSTDRQQARGRKELAKIGGMSFLRSVDSFTAATGNPMISLFKESAQVGLQTGIAAFGAISNLLNGGPSLPAGVPDLQTGDRRQSGGRGASRSAPKTSSPPKGPARTPPVRGGGPGWGGLLTTAVAVGSIALSEGFDWEKIKKNLGFGEKKNKEEWFESYFGVPYPDYLKRNSQPANEETGKKIENLNDTLEQNTSAILKNVATGTLLAGSLGAAASKLGGPLGPVAKGAIAGAGATAAGLSAAGINFYFGALERGYGTMENYYRTSLLLNMNQFNSLAGSGTLGGPTTNAVQSAVMRSGLLGLGFSNQEILQQYGLANRSAFFGDYSSAVRASGLTGRYLGLSPEEMLGTVSQLNQLGVGSGRTFGAIAALGSDRGGQVTAYSKVFADAFVSAARQLSLTSTGSSGLALMESLGMTRNVLMGSSIGNLKTLAERSPEFVTQQIASLDQFIRSGLTGNAAALGMNLRAGLGFYQQYQGATPENIKAQISQFITESGIGAYMVGGKLTSVGMEFLTPAALERGLSPDVMAALVEAAFKGQLDSAADKFVKDFDKGIPGPGNVSRDGGFEKNLKANEEALLAMANAVQTNITTISEINSALTNFGTNLLALGNGIMKPLGETLISVGKEIGLFSKEANEESIFNQLKKQAEGTFTGKIKVPAANTVNQINRNLSVPEAAAPAASSSGASAPMSTQADYAAAGLKSRLGMQGATMLILPPMTELQVVPLDYDPRKK